MRLAGRSRIGVGAGQGDKVDPGRWWWRWACLGGAAAGGRVLLAHEDEVGEDGEGEEQRAKDKVPGARVAERPGGPLAFQLRVEQHGADAEETPGVAGVRAEWRRWRWWMRRQAVRWWGWGGREEALDVVCTWRSRQGSHPPTMLKSSERAPIAACTSVCVLSTAVTFMPSELTHDEPTSIKEPTRKHVVPRLR